MSQLVDHDDRIRICDCSKIEDGRPTLSWSEKDFDLCFNCLEKLYIKYLDPKLKKFEEIVITRKTIKEELRNKVFERDKYKCVKCGKKEKLVMDHIVPFIRGGKTELKNLQTLCSNCNRIKGAKVINA